MDKYRHSRKKRQQQLLLKRIRFAVLLIASVIAIVLVFKSCKTDNGSFPPVAPSSTPTQTATPIPTTSIDPTTQPTADPTTTPTATPAEVQADLLKKVANKDGIKTAYLTFDDGPTTSVTSKVLDTLRKYNVKATFFQVGVNIEQNPDMARRVYEEGHLIGNHSYAHKYSELYSSEDSFMSDVKKTENLILNITGETPDEMFKLFRFPGGGYNAGSHGAKKQNYKKSLEQSGYVYCDWNALNKDAEGKQPKTAQELLDCVKETAKAEDIVVLMHDAPAKKTTAEALPSIIEYLTSQGYEFRRLDGEK